MSEVFSLHSMKVQLHQLVDDIDALLVELTELAKNLDEHYKRICKAKVGGATGAIGGGTLAAIGFGLSFVTFGASLGLTIAGGVIASSGGIVVSGSQFVDVILSRNRRSSAKKIVKKYKSRVELLVTECVKIDTLLQNYGDIDVKFHSWVKLRGTVALLSGINSTGSTLICSTVRNSLRIASYVDDVMSTGASATTTTFKTIGSTAGRALHIVGGVAGIVFLLVDINTLRMAANDILKKNPHETSKKIRELAAEIKTKCPTRENIHDMVEETIANVSHV